MCTKVHENIFWLVSEVTVRGQADGWEHTPMRAQNVISLLFFYSGEEACQKQLNCLTSVISVKC